MEENTFINVSKDMMSFIEKSPTAFQVTANFIYQNSICLWFLALHLL